MGTPLVIVLDRDAGEAAYEQIAAQIREGVATGALAPGSLLPGVRVVASDLGVNFNTVARAYRLLEEQGFVRIRDRSGVEVVTPAPRPARDAGSGLERELWEVLVRMRQAGFSPGQLRRAVDAFLDRLAD
ncbi:MAG TPA: GntR family transcriptional regulator [Vicinamibacterales bacterium]|nr:GntR family transcriptional regulator [Vicinamibacterales bacterium]